MMPKRVAKRPYFSLSAFVEYSLTSSSRLSDEDARDMAVANTACDPIGSNLLGGNAQRCPEGKATLARLEGAFDIECCSHKV